MVKENLLKEQLEVIKDNEWEITDEIEVYNLAKKSLKNIGSTDPVLRDELILTFLWKLIINKKITEVQIRELLGISLSDEHLFYKLGAKDDDSIFNRAFTVLIVRWIIHYHHSFEGILLNNKELNMVFESVIKYVRQEKDVRGYVPDKGWAHAIAHSGDALRTLALCDEIGHDQLLEILNVIKEKASISYYVYKNEEMERLVTAIVNVLQRNVLATDEVINWLKSFKEFDKPDTYPPAHYWKENVKNLLRSLYFRLQYLQNFTTINHELEKVLHELNQFFNKLSKQNK